MIRAASSCWLLVLVTILSVSCGSSRTLRSVAVLPAAADARNFPNGQVPFAAGGIFSQPPSPVTLTSKDVTWCIGDSSGGCVGNINPGATVTADGIAQCAGTFTGTVTILAGQGIIGTASPDGPYHLKVYGSAQLTCP
jgi:hypothetical protein